MTLKLTYAGFNYVADVDGSYTADSIPTMVSDTAANSVALTVDYGINASTDSVYADYSTDTATGSTESIADIEAAAQEAKNAGQSVIIRPLIDFLPDASTAMLTGSNGNVYADGNWRAYYNPGSTANGIAFLQSYAATVLMPLAAVANSVGAAILDIGTEMDQLTGPAYESTWDSIIATIKADYPTLKLTYSAIGDDDLSPWQYGPGTAPAAGTGDIDTQVSFWNRLSYMGIDEYSALSNSSTPTLQSLINAWEQAFTDDGTGSATDATADQTGGESLIQYYEGAAADATAGGLPLLFTEIGYNSAPDAASQPFFTSSSTYDPTLQAELYQAFLTAWKQDGNASLNGVWFWNWEPDPTTVGAGLGPNWTPQGNTAALADTKTAFLAAESPSCYLRGTRIATPAGETEVQDLREGDLVRTAAGRLRPIRWVGTRSYRGRSAGPAVQPILFPAGCLGAGLPRRDLYLSPEHALFLGGALIPAIQLCDGNIRQVAHGGSIDYVHVELDDHDLLLAEGVPAESFVDDGSRTSFADAGEQRQTLPLPAFYCAPRLEQGFQLEAIRRSLAARLAEPAVA